MMTDLHIGFSHRYFKMPSNCESRGAKLIDAWFSPKGTLSKEFIEYDTAYPGGHYPLGSHDKTPVIYGSVRGTSEPSETLHLPPLRGGVY